MESISSRPLAPPRAPRRSTQIHCWPPAGFYCSCPSSPCRRRRRRAKKRNGERDRDSLHRRGKECCKSACLKKESLTIQPSIFVLSPSLCPLSIFLQVLNLAKVRFIPPSSPILSGIGAECRTRRRREGEQQRNWMTHSSHGEEWNRNDALPADEVIHAGDLPWTRR